MCFNQVNIDFGHSYTGNQRDTASDAPCPITIHWLGVLHNTVMKIKMNKLDCSLAGYFDKTLTLSAEWLGWSKFQKKNASRLAHMLASPSLEPVKEGGDELVMNPPLILRKNETCGTVNCALTANKDSVSFANQYAAAIKEYNKTIFSKAIPSEDVINFHSLLFMEFQYFGGCETRWKDSVDSADCGESNSGDGGSTMATKRYLFYQARLYLPCSMEQRNIMPSCCVLG